MYALVNGDMKNFLCNLFATQSLLAQEMYHKIHDSN